MRPELWIFDLDGTIVDVRESYREAIRRTVQAYFGQIIGLRGSEALVTPRDIQAMKLGGGLANGWELSSAIIHYLLSLTKSHTHRPEGLENLGDISNFLRRAGHRLNLTMGGLRRRADFEQTATALHQAGGGLAGLAKVLGHEKHPLLFDQGALQNVNVVQRLFQEFYLGRRSYAALHGSQPFFYKGPGMIENEHLLIPREHLEQLATLVGSKFAIATNRPVAEIKLALDRHQISRYFSAIVAHEDVLGETARAERRGEPTKFTKPHPFMLLEAADRLGNRTQPAVYIGDAPDDVTAALRANEVRPYAAWGALWGSIDPERTRVALAEAGASRVLTDPTELLTFDQ